MPEWAVALLGCLAISGVLILGNATIISLQSLGGIEYRPGQKNVRPSRWYLLFFASHEVLAPMTPGWIGRLGMLGVSVGILAIFISFFRNPLTKSVLYGWLALFCSGFVVVWLRSR